jgi:site-specific recombinase XerD
MSVITGWQEQTEGTEGLVFVNGEGQRFGWIKTSWSKLLKDAEIENFRWHDMRHHFASHLVMGGVDLNTVRELLGHSDYAMTLRYAHLAPEHKLKAVEVLDRRAV